MSRTRSAGVIAPLAALAALAGVVSSARAQSFSLVGTLPEGGSSYVQALSADGLTAAGSTGAAHGNAGFVWTAAGGRTDFGIGLVPTQTLGISGDGRYAVGGDLFGGPAAFRWSQAGGYQNIGTLPGFTQSQANDASFDGSVVVGTLATAPNGATQAFRWTQAGGMQGLGGGTRAEAISGDGNVIVGSTGPFGNRPFVWTAASGIQFLSTIDGTISGYAFGVNHNGSIVVGYSGVELRGTRWINGVPLDQTNGSTSANLNPTGLSDDGAVVVGQLIQGGGILSAGVWTQGTGMVRLADYLTANGVTIPTGVTLGSCTAVSADGRTFAGVAGIPSGGGQGFVATVPAPCPADLDNDGNFANGGVRDRAVTIDDLLYFLAAFEAGSFAADLDNGSGTGTHDNAVTVEDLLFFLVHFEAGC